MRVDVESMLRAFLTKAAKHPDKDPMAKSMRELLTCVAGAGADFLASDHKEPAGVISDLMRSKSLTVERCWSASKHFVGCHKQP